MDEPLILQSIADTHEQPFVVIDRTFHVVAINRAFEESFGATPEQVIGQPCYKVSHNNDRPCYELGEECPHRHIFEGGESSTCLHTHYDGHDRVHRVKIKAYPINTGDNLFLGESLLALSKPLARHHQAFQMVGQSPVFMQLLEQLRLAAQSDAPILIEGESGTGKELAAQFIHQHSQCHDKPFLVMDCTTLTESLFESEVFGHERGAFTGSAGEKQGLFEAADGGTLFLDEVGELPASLQAKLLRVLESGEFRRVGGHKSIRTSVRIICATNRDLILDIQNRTFREDLFYRIACFHITLPPLSERLTDIPILTESLLEKIGNSSGRRYELGDGALKLLLSHHYPGNIRELRNILRIAAAHAPGGHIDDSCISGVLQQLQSRRSRSPAIDTIPPENTPAAAMNLDDLESQHINWLLKQHSGNRRKVAASLGVSERTMYRKLKRLNLS